MTLTTSRLGSLVMEAGSHYAEKHRARRSNTCTFPWSPRNGFHGNRYTPFPSSSFASSFRSSLSTSSLKDLKENGCLLSICANLMSFHENNEKNRNLISLEVIQSIRSNELYFSTGPSSDSFQGQVTHENTNISFSGKPPEMNMFRITRK